MRTIGRCSAVIASPCMAERGAQCARGALERGPMDANTRARVARRYAILTKGFCNVHAIAVADWRRLEQRISNGTQVAPLPVCRSSRNSLGLTGTVFYPF
jgi:hypothetical protein